MSQKQIKSVCVFCGSALGNNVIYKQTAADLGTLMLQKKLSLVYGGSNIGLMMVIADVMTEGGGQVIGVMSENLAARKIVRYCRKKEDYV
jgi:predicted Rossmann-fold nucleotide-binding protein